MAVGTRLSNAAIAELAAAFGLGPVRSWRSIPQGTINSNFELAAGAGHFFLRVNEGKSDTDVAYEHSLVAELAARGVPTPRPRTTTSGSPFASYAGKQISLFPWLEGEHRQGVQITEPVARAVGAVLADLHLRGAPLVDRFSRAGIYTTAAMRDRWCRFRDSDDPELAEVIELLADEFVWLDGAADSRQAAPAGVIHGDLFPDNVLFEVGAGPRLVAILDFEQASVGSLAYDLAVCVNAWCFGAQLRSDLASAVLGGYQSRRSLGDAEQKALYCELRASALRFTVTRITDIHLAGVDRAGKDFRDYQRRLLHWRSVGEEAVRQLLSGAG